MFFDNGIDSIDNFLHGVLFFDFESILHIHIMNIEFLFVYNLSIIT